MSDPDFTPSIGDVVRTLREVRGWSQMALGHRLGVEPSAVAAWERGRHNPSLRHVEALARLFETRLVCHGDRWGTG